MNVCFRRLWAQFVGQALSWRQQCGMEGKGRVDGSRARSFTSVRNASLSRWRYHAHPLIFLLLVSEVPIYHQINEIGTKQGRYSPGEVCGLEVRDRRLAPDLEEMYLFVPVGVLAMADASTCRGHLQVAALEHLSVAHGVVTTGSCQKHKTHCAKDLLLQFSGNNVGEYLKLAMAVCPETLVGFDTILVQDTEASKLSMLRIVIACTSIKHDR